MARGNPWPPHSHTHSAWLYVVTHSCTADAKPGGPHKARGYSGLPCWECQLDVTPSGDEPLGAAAKDYLAGLN